MMMVAVQVAVPHVVIELPPASASVTVGLLANPPKPPMPLHRLLVTLA